MSVIPAPKADQSVAWYEPSTMDQALRLADYLSKSQFCPDSFRGKPSDVLCAIMYGATVGMSPTQALQGVAVVRGKPSLFGDSLLAVCRAHPEFEDIKESFDEEAMAATCEVKRKGQSWHRATFTQTDASRAQLWGNKGPWTQYPKRMLQMRARGFALRDTFADALAGLISFEEAQDMPEEKPADVVVHEVKRETKPQHSSKSDELLSQLGAEEPDAVVLDEEPEAHAVEAQPEGNDLRTKEGVAKEIASICRIQQWDLDKLKAICWQAGITTEWNGLGDLGMPDLRKLLGECEDVAKADAEGASG